MNINDFISNYTNHPVLFIGTGISLRYLKKSYTWDSLLKKISFDLKGSDDFFYDLKSDCEVNDKYKYDKIASALEKEFNEDVKNNREGKFKWINDAFYANMDNNIKISRFKIYITSLLSSLDYKESMTLEIQEFKKARKNIGSIITTNYDKLIEDIFEFSPLIGNNILLSNPYGSIYKVHGCVSEPDKIIITYEDYQKFNTKFELIRAQLLSLFIHNPIIFIGYNIGDENIKDILKTIFYYIDPNTDDAERIRKNFLLIEYEKGSCSHEIVDHNIDLEGFSTIRINKIKTDDYKSIYFALSELSLSISAMDVRKVQKIVKEIYSGGSIKVKITEDLDSLKNSDRIIAIGSPKTIRYEYQTIAEMMANYFIIIDEENFQLLTLIDKYTVQPGQYFPIYGFSRVCKEIKSVNKLQQQQNLKIKTSLESIKEGCKSVHKSIEEIESDERITSSNKINAIIWSAMENNIKLEDLENYLRNFKLKKKTDYRKLLCVYDFKRYSDEK